MSREEYNRHQRGYRANNREQFQKYEKNRKPEAIVRRRVQGRIRSFISSLLRIGADIPEDIVLPPPYISNLEYTVVERIKLEFPNFDFIKIRPDWLLNPKTNRPLELDLYCDLLKLAI